MQSFESGFIESQPINQNLMRTIRLIGEYKYLGKINCVFVIASGTK
ncbi:MAG: hypothetical protein WBA07_20220 [Rivularia sp. (in: cyanobacteria)]